MTTEEREAALRLPWSQQYNFPEWNQKRLRIQARDKMQCRFCGGHRPWLEIHHSKYWKDTINRQLFTHLPWEYPDWMLLTLCKPCHDKMKEPDTDFYAREVCEIYSNRQTAADPTQYDVVGEITVFEHLLMCKDCSAAVYRAAIERKQKLHDGRIKTSRIITRLPDGSLSPGTMEDADMYTPLVKVARKQIERCFGIKDDDWLEHAAEIWMAENKETADAAEQAMFESAWERLKRQKDSDDDSTG
jgi:hypothetical protein